MKKESKKVYPVNFSHVGLTVPNLEVNYLLRGLPIPAGKHQVEFKFEPQVIQTGNILTLLSLGGILLLLCCGVFYYIKNVNNSKSI
ncbi:hypothetical protein [Myroides odoratus]|uniref:hypothetical protein n=1 Tax=Myroides odoratus TaxID=256 RepID=UPI0039AFD9B0